MTSLYPVKGTVTITVSHRQTHQLVRNLISLPTHFLNYGSTSPAHFTRLPSLTWSSLTHIKPCVSIHTHTPSCFFRFSAWPASGCGKLLCVNLPAKSPANTDSHISRFLRWASITVCLCASVGSCTRPFHTYYSSQTLYPLMSSFPISQ